MTCCLELLLSDGPNVYDVPKVVTLEGWEFIKYGDVYMSRTYEHFSWPYCPSKYDLFNFWGLPDISL